jgi:hypothetical protein
MTPAIARADRTPTTEVNVILRNLNDAYQRLVIDRNSNKKTPKELRLQDVQLLETDFFKERFLPGAMCADDLVAYHSKKCPANDDGIFNLDELHAIVITLAFCIEAIAAEGRNERDLAWKLIIDSMFWHTASLSQKPRRIEVIKNRKKISNEKSIKAKKEAKKYEQYREFIYAEYTKGVKGGLWKNPFKAKDLLDPMLRGFMKDNNLDDLKESNLNEWIYRTLKTLLKKAN